jgi:hypothetical protein
MAARCSFCGATSGPFGKVEGPVYGANLWRLSGP